MERLDPCKLRGTYDTWGTHAHPIVIFGGSYWLLYSCAIYPGDWMPQVVRSSAQRWWEGVHGVTPVGTELAEGHEIHHKTQHLYMSVGLEVKAASAPWKQI